VAYQNTAGARGGLSFPLDRLKQNFMKGRYASMTPGFEIALAIGLVVGFAALARSFPIGVIKQHGEGTFSNPGALAA
jgi:hypothetical protein